MSTARRRLGLVAIDQGLSGGTNVLAIVLSARILDPDEFGLFPMVFLIYGLVITGTRAVIGYPAIVHPEETRGRRREVFGAGWLLGLGAAGALALAAGLIALWDARMAAALAVLACCLPLLVIQDLGRFVAFSQRQPAHAVLFDTTWLLLFVPPAVMLDVADVESLPLTVAVWAGAGALSGLLPLVLQGALRPVSGVGWAKQNWHLSWRFAIVTTAAQLSTLVIAAFILGAVGPGLVGAAIGAELLMRPYMLVETTVVTSGTAEVANSGRDRFQIEAHTRRTRRVALVVAVANASLALLLPDSVGREVLGDVWKDAEPFVLPFAVQIILRSLATGHNAALVGMGMVNLSMWIGLSVLSALLVGFISGTLIAGVAGGLWAGAMVWGAQSLVWLGFYRRRIDAATASGPVSAPGAGAAPQPGRDLDSPDGAAPVDPTPAGPRGERGDEPTPSAEPSGTT